MQSNFYFIIKYVEKIDVIKIEGGKSDVDTTI